MIMKEHKFREYLYMGITAVLVIMACITLVFIFIRWDSVQIGIKNINKIFAPITYGAILAYLLAPIYNRTLKHAGQLFTTAVKNEKRRHSIAKFTATIVSLVVLFVVIVGLIWMVLPEVVRSIMTVINSLPSNAESLSLWIQTVFANNPEVEVVILDVYNQAMEKFITWSTTDLVPNLERIISGVFSGVFVGVVGVVNLVMDGIIGIIVMVYLLNIKDTLCAQAKKGIYGFFALPLANEIIEKFRFIHGVFGGFITGKILDSAIIGVICFFCLSIMRMPYVLLISVIIAVTNIIPFFGPFIGAVPSAILLLLVSPIQCLYFLIFIFLLQQFDGNILGPKILGDSTGLSSFWVLFSILVFGGILGPVGMIIGVPLFAVIYRLISERIVVLLQRKKLSENTADYGELDYIDETSMQYISLHPSNQEEEENNGKSV